MPCTKVYANVTLWAIVNVDYDTYCNSKHIFWVLGRMTRPFSPLKLNVWSILANKRKWRWRALFYQRKFKTLGMGTSLVGSGYDVALPLQGPGFDPWSRPLILHAIFGATRKWKENTRGHVLHCAHLTVMTAYTHMGGGLWQPAHLVDWFQPGNIDRTTPLPSSTFF